MSGRGCLIAVIWLSQASGCEDDSGSGGADAGSADAALDRGAESGWQSDAPLDRSTQDDVLSDVGASLDASATKYDFFMQIEGGIFTGKRFEVTILELPERRKVGGRDVPMFPSGGTLGIQINRVLESGRSYDVDFYSDSNGTGQCDAEDPSWRRKVLNVTGIVTLHHTAEVPSDSICK